MSGTPPPTVPAEPSPEPASGMSVLHLVGGVCVVTVACELDMVTTPALGQLLTEELAGGHRVLLVELSGCDFLGSSGLAVLVAARETASSLCTQFALAGPTRTVTRALEATGLDAVFAIYPTVAAALAHLDGGLAH